MDSAVLRDLFLIVGAALAAYFGAYFKQRGRDQAIEDRFNKVLEQTKETTKATKKIEAKITDELWDRQKQWELKRDVLFLAMKNINEREVALIHLRKDDPPSVEAHRKAALHLDQANLLIAVTCAPDTNPAFDEYVKEGNSIATKIHEGVLGVYKLHEKNLDEKLEIIQQLVRKELLTALRQ
jgi:hypothetical protein